MRLMSCVLISGLISALSLAGCGGGSATDDSSVDAAGDSVDDGTVPDAPIGDGDLQPPAQGFQIKSPEVVIHPGEEITYCYYFHTPNTGTVAINHFASKMTPGSHHMIMFTTNGDVQPVGTISSQNCGIANNGNSIPFWTYSTQTPESDLSMPADDGTGKPLAIEIPANTSGYLQMHYLNATDEDLHAHVTLNADSLDAGVAYTRTAAYVTYNEAISIPAGAQGFTATQKCDVPAGGKFWLMSTHSHHRSTHTAVKNGVEMTFQSSDWEHPEARMWMTPATFYTFASKVTYECTWNNETGHAIVDGDSAIDNEMCMASGYYFIPGGQAKPAICVDSFLLPN